MVIIVLAILCFGAIFPFKSLQKSQRRAYFNLTIAEIQQNLQNHQSAPLQTLDNNPENAFCESCFSEALKESIKNKLWFKIDNKTYRFSIHGEPQTDTEAFVVTYDPQTGKLAVAQ